MPFRFGAVTMTEMAVVYVRVHIETSDGTSAQGVGASVLSPMWFDKDASRSFSERERTLFDSMRMASDAYRDADPAPAYALHELIQPAVRRACADRSISSLASSFGVALMDSAIVDAICAFRETGFHSALNQDLFGFGPVKGLPTTPASSLFIRHTVGLVDPLVASDLDDPLADGLPETLEDVIREYGVTYFKIKISGDVEANVDRLCRIAEVLGRLVPRGYRAVLDGNEQFADMAAFEPFVAAIADEPRLAEFFANLLWIEQPVERDAALAPSAGVVLQRVAEHKPVILDESDGTDEVTELALRLGYAGVSAKNCKGVFRTLHSHRVLANLEAPGILAAEDLTNPGILPLHQDTAVVTALGIQHAERNAHHYVRGIAFLPEAEQERALREFPSVYERTSGGLVRLRIHDGKIDTKEIAARGYGTGSRTLDFDALEPLDLPAPGAPR